MDAIIRQTIHVTLQKANRSNDTLQSFLVTNLTVVLENAAGDLGSGARKLEYVSGGGTRTGGTAADNAGAGYYVLAVLLVYSMSVVALLASHIKRKHVKILEDREIHKYLREFQVRSYTISVVWILKSVAYTSGLRVHNCGRNRPESKEEGPLID